VTKWNDAAVYGEGWSRLMREHKNMRMVRRIVSSPAFPGVIFPGIPNRPEHITTQDPGADIFERLNGKIVIDTLGPTALAVHLLELPVS